MANREPVAIEQRLWKVQDVADYLAMSTSWVYKQAEAGMLPTRRLGASLRFAQVEIEAYAKGLWKPPNTGASVLVRKR
jgi:predicted DNA-binding transcriptional regulator AlpA